ncbi:MAG: hypothetical protein ACR2NA_05720 [Solirubrobacterales bacterium]
MGADLLRIGRLDRSGDLGGTVETHVRDIFATLDVGSRAAVARVVEREDRLTVGARGGGG